MREKIRNLLAAGLSGIMFSCAMMPAAAFAQEFSNDDPSVSQSTNEKTVEEKSEKVKTELTGTDFTGWKREVQLSKQLQEIPLTFEAWINVPASSKGTRNIMIGNYSDYYIKLPVASMELTTNGEPRLFWSTKGKNYDYRATGLNVCNGEWTHVAITAEPDPNDSTKTLMTTYINGEKAHSSSMVCNREPLDQRMYIGRDWRDSIGMNGKMAQIRIWSDTRTAQEIKDNYQYSVDPNEDGLLLDLDFNSEIEGRFVDHSANGNYASDAWFKDDSLFKKASDGYQTIAVIPDTQTITYHYPESFKPMTQWIADHKDELGIQFAIHVGDIVSERTYDSEWKVASEGMKILEDAGIPYVFSPGNHDTVIKQINGVWHGVRSTPLMNKYFPYSKFSQADTFGGAFKEGEMDNTYSFFTVSGVEFLVISMEENPRDEVLEWADGIIAANPDKKVILTTHEYMFWDKTLYNSSTQDALPFEGGQNFAVEVYDKLTTKYENIVSVICGHCPYPDVVERHDTGKNGNDITTFMADNQQAEKFDIMTNNRPGYGMVMLLSFKENSNEVSVRWVSTVRDSFYGPANQYETTVALHDETPDTDTSKFLLDLIVKSVENTDLGEYLPKAQDEFKSALAEAKDILENSEDQSAINASVARLHSAWMELRFTPSEDKLQEIREKYGY